MKSQATNSRHTNRIQLTKNFVVPQENLHIPKFGRCKVVRQQQKVTFRINFLFSSSSSLALTFIVPFVGHSYFWFIVLLFVTLLKFCLKTLPPKQTFNERASE